MNEQQHDAAVALAKIKFQDSDIFKAFVTVENSLVLRVKPFYGFREARPRIFASELLELYTALTGEEVVDESDSGLVPKERLESVGLELERVRACFAEVQKQRDRAENDPEYFRQQLKEACESAQRNGELPTLTRKQKSEITRSYLQELIEESEGEVTFGGPLADGHAVRINICRALLAFPPLD